MFWYLAPEGTSNLSFAICFWYLAHVHMPDSPFYKIGYILSICLNCKLVLEGACNNVTML